VRSFIALEIPAALRSALAAAEARLARTEADVKWVEVDNLHLTLKFLGDVAPERLPQLQESLSELVTTRRPFELSVAGLGAFPSLAEPNVIWAGLANGASECTALWRAVEEACARLGYPRERKPFTPHLTLGRRRSGYNLSALSHALRTDADTTFGVAMIDGMTLYRSDLRPSGPVYTKLGEYRFGG